MRSAVILIDQSVSEIYLLTLKFNCDWKRKVAKG